MKIFKGILLTALSMNIAFADDWSTAFPTGGFTGCSKEKGNIDIATIMRLAKIDPIKTHKEIAKKQTCANPASNNPNFRTSLTNACKRSVSMPVDLQDVITLCNTVGVQLNAPGPVQNVLANVGENVTDTQTEKLLKIAFPTPGVGNCWGTRGALNFDAITTLAQMPHAQNDLNQRIQNVHQCVNPSNPTFVGNLSQSCKIFQNSSSKNTLINLRPDITKLCSDIGVSLDAMQPQNIYAAPQQDQNMKIDALFKKAFPQTGFTNCAAGRGRLDFSAIAELKALPVVQQYLGQKIVVAHQCANSTNPNFLNELKNSCTLLKASPALNALSDRPDVLDLCTTAGVPVQPQIAASLPVFPAAPGSSVPAPVVVPEPTPVTIQPQEPYDKLKQFFEEKEKKAAEERNQLSQIQFPDPNDQVFQDLVNENMFATKASDDYAKNILSVFASAHQG